ncbi:putative six-hairpin glycosidase-like superfamily [Helianthus annuus]|uniref:Six-hairpin glycosidase-like superfamily n=1 Tax=Helianthus annuus TaxID=4232 RepID=A0A9K3GVP1_HELAN|nr:putative six-hairpin glycosidase-like superfamily [Helianthus annuus]KAJ0449010.1 putative six-hairpin glycosidase-like superfamily [Helianthus annuus]KAJ0828087.1 putative six-hairpin glycosidase-like superfamily [Helianthus annuus]
MVDYYLAKFKEIDVSKDFQSEMIGGKAGYLWACLFLNKNLGHETILPAHTVRILPRL